MNMGKWQMEKLYAKKGLGFHEAFSRSYVGWLIRRFGLKTGRIMDLGCGYPIHSMTFKSLGFDVVMVDKEETAPGVVTCDIEHGRLPYKGGSFDYVLFANVIEHLHDHDNAMREIRRVLKPGGKVILLTNDLQKWGFKFWFDCTHFHPYDKNSIRQLMDFYDFKVEALQNFSPLPLIWKYTGRAFDYLRPDKEWDMIVVARK